jgi:hypothetical protein
VKIEKEWKWGILLSQKKVYEIEKNNDNNPISKTSFQNTGQMGNYIMK